MDQNIIKRLVAEIKQDISKIDLKKMETKREELKKQSEKSDFWEDNQKATKIMQNIAEIDEKISSWKAILNEANDLLELTLLEDESLSSDIESQFRKVSDTYNKLHMDLAYAGPYDEHSALLDIHAGAGGTDAQDWAAMMQRMYLRWAESNSYKAKILDESSGEEAGIKSVSIEISGKLAYGKLKGEHGVHRLVRLSPFNANNLRQTSFAKVEVLPEIDEPETVPIDEKDLRIDVFRAGGHGGQSVNTTDSAVRVTHIPTGITVSIQNERSQIQNKETALKILRSKLAQLQIEQHSEKISELKGPNKSAEWGNQIRSYVLHPYKQVKDLRTKQESSDPDKVLDGELNDFIDAFNSWNIK
ncbi:peptide chain release factor 2 [Candidatus Saccharibacteria bacterium]|nr:peptide chain release factor 2 [Candidatus Saccharibacteria bacterium]